MNKKLKIFLALTLVIQLLVPSFLLVYHYSVLSTAKSLETEYKFELDNFSLDYYYDLKAENPTDRLGAPMQLDIYKVSSWRNSKYSLISTPENNVVSVQKLREDDNTDTWFYGRSFSEICRIAPENYSYVEGIDPHKVRTAIRAEYNFEIPKDRESAYLSAKIYKGVFIPTGIYFRGEKIIDINM